jgi:hypothetical protein
MMEGIMIEIYHNKDYPRYRTYKLRWVPDPDNDWIFFVALGMMGAGLAMLFLSWVL